MKCIICGNEDFTCIHKGTRDVSELNVMKCHQCGMVQLDNRSYNSEQKYEAGGMLKNSYSVLADKKIDRTWDVWLKESTEDDDRRYKDLMQICRGKRVLEFGCGNGGFLRRIRNVAKEADGIELMQTAREKLKQEGITVWDSLAGTSGKYDVVCMFNVIEHLNEPDNILKAIYDVVDEGGVFVCETCNVNCVLTSLYHCSAYEDFTYWSEHVFLFDSSTLEKIINRAGFLTKWNTQIERYSLANHLYWLSYGKPGGHGKWIKFNDKQLNDKYEKLLVEEGIADTLWYCGVKRT